MVDAGIEGYFTNHSARRTGGTILFRAGVQRKLVKEATGHRSDAVDKYQITSDKQREMMSKVIAGQHVDEVREVCQPQSIVKQSENAEKVVTEVSITDQNESKEGQKCQFNDKSIGTLIDQVIENVKSEGKPS